MATTRVGSESGALPPNIAVGPRIPQGLAMAVEGLTREVLRHRPEDIYVFAARHFEKLLQLRERHRLGVRTGDKVTRPTAERCEASAAGRQKQRTRSRSRTSKSGWSLSETAKVLERHRRIFGESEMRISTEDVRALAQSKNDEWTVTTTVTTTATTTTFAPDRQRGESGQSYGRERSRSRRRRSNERTSKLDVATTVEQQVRSHTRFPPEVSGGSSLRRRGDRSRTEKKEKGKERETRGESSKHGTSIRVSRRRRVPENAESKGKSSETRCSGAPRMDRVKDYVVRTFASSRGLEELQSTKYVEKVQDVIDKTAPIIKNKLDELKSASRASRQTSIDIYADGTRGGNAVSESSPASSGSEEEATDKVHSVDTKPTVVEERDLTVSNDDTTLTRSHLAVRRSSSCKDVRVTSNGSQQDLSKVSLPAVRPRSSKNGRTTSKSDTDHTFDQLVLPPISPDAFKCPKRKDDVTLPMLPAAASASATASATASASSSVAIDGNGKERANNSMDGNTIMRNNEDNLDDGNVATDRSGAIVEEVFRDSLNVTPDAVEASPRPDSLEMEPVDDVDDEAEGVEARQTEGLANKLKEIEVAGRNVERILNLSTVAKESSNEQASSDNVEEDNTIRTKLREVEETEKRIDEILVGTEKMQEIENDKSSTTHSAGKDDTEEQFCYILTEGSPCEIPESVTTVIIPDRPLVSPASEAELDEECEDTVEPTGRSTVIIEESEEKSKQNGAFGEYIRPDSNHTYDDVDYIRSLKLPHDVNIGHQDLDRIKEEEEEDEENQANKVKDEQMEKEISPKTSREEKEEEKRIHEENPSISTSLLEDIPEHEEKETSIPGDAKEANAADDVERSIAEAAVEITELASSESSNDHKDTTATEHSSTAESLSLDPSRPIVPELNLDSLQDITVSSMKPLTDTTDGSMDDMNNGNENGNETSLQSCSIHISSRLSDESHATIEHRGNDLSSGGIKSSSDAEEIVKESPSENEVELGDAPIEIQDSRVEKGEEKGEEKGGERVEEEEEKEKKKKKSDDIEEEIAKELIEIDRSENLRALTCQEKEESLKEPANGTNDDSEDANDSAPTEEVRDLIRELVITEEISRSLPKMQQSQKSEDSESIQPNEGGSSRETSKRESPKADSPGEENQEESVDLESRKDEHSPAAAEPAVVQEKANESLKTSSSEKSVDAEPEDKVEATTKEEEENVGNEQGEDVSAQEGFEENGNGKEQRSDDELKTDSVIVSENATQEEKENSDKRIGEEESKKSSETASVNRTDSRNSDVAQNGEKRQCSEEKKDESEDLPKDENSDKDATVKSGVEVPDAGKASVEENVSAANVSSTVVEPAVESAVVESREKSVAVESAVEEPSPEGSIIDKSVETTVVTEPEAENTISPEVVTTESDSEIPVVTEITPTPGGPAVAEAIAADLTVNKSTVAETSIADGTNKVPADPESPELSREKSSVDKPSNCSASVDRSSADDPSIEQSGTISSDGSTETAATRIQAGVRGFLTRRRLRSVQQIGASTLDSIPSIQDNATIEREAPPPEQNGATEESNRESKIRQQRLRREDAVQKKTLSLENAFAPEGMQHTGEFHDCLPLPILLPERPRSERSSSPRQAASSSTESPSVPNTPSEAFTHPSVVPNAVNELLEHRIGINAEHIVDLLVLQLASSAEEANLQSHYLNFITSVEDTCDDPTPITTDFPSSKATTVVSEASDEEMTREGSLREPLALPRSPRGVVIEEIGTSLETIANDEDKGDREDSANVPDNGGQPTDHHRGKETAP